MSNRTSFEYSDKKYETPFETFLRYTDEKEKSSKVLSNVLRKAISGKDSISIFDIGTGNGEYLELTLKQLNYRGRLYLTLLEPSKDLAEDLKTRVKSYFSKYSVEIITKTWEAFNTQQSYDIVLASHLYHINRADYLASFKKMINLLNRDGHLVFVLREIDDAYTFKMTFKPLLFEEKFQAKILDEALKSFKKISKEIPLDIEVFESESTLKVPLESNFADAVSIIEFYLNKKWDEIPNKVQNRIIEYIVKKKNVLYQKDGIALIKKRYPASNI